MVCGVPFMVSNIKKMTHTIQDMNVKFVLHV